MEQLLLAGAMIMAGVAIFLSVVLLVRYFSQSGIYRFSINHLTMLIFVYTTVILAFAVVYLSLSLQGFQVIQAVDFRSMTSVWDIIETTVYFSGVTLLTVGYGDYVPLGIGRYVALLQALLGYLLPAAFVVSTVMMREKHSQ